MSDDQPPAPDPNHLAWDRMAADLMAYIGDVHRRNAKTTRPKREPTPEEIADQEPF